MPGRSDALAKSWEAPDCDASTVAAWLRGIGVGEAASLAADAVVQVVLAACPEKVGVRWVRTDVPPRNRLLVRAVNPTVPIAVPDEVADLLTGITDEWRVDEGESVWCSFVTRNVSPAPRQRSPRASVRRVGGLPPQVPRSDAQPLDRTIRGKDN